MVDSDLDHSSVDAKDPTDDDPLEHSTLLDIDL